VAYSNRGLVLSNLLRYEDALASCDRAIALRPDDAKAHANRGLVLSRLQRHADALASYDRAIALHPDQAKALAGRSVILADLHRHAEAQASLDRAIALSPDYADAYWYQGLCSLALGQFEHGWKLYEWRKRRDQPIGNGAFKQPVWLGDTSIAGKTLFIHWEQGLGDTIQFCRYATLATARGARVVMSVQDPLRRLLQTVGPDIGIIGGNDVPAAFDGHCPMMSLPLAFGTTLETIPNETPYLAADPAAVARWRLRVAALAGLRVGLCWAGNPRTEQPSAHAIDLRRSITLAQYAPLAGVAGATFRGAARPPVVARLDGRAHRLRRHRRPDRGARPGDHGRHRRGASGRRVGQDGVDPQPLRCVLALADGSRRFSVVSHRPAVAPTQTRRLGQRRRQGRRGIARPCPAHAGRIAGWRPGSRWAAGRSRPQAA
jgi:tetratricopeptide (TPR) repeat protein